MTAALIQTIGNCDLGTPSDISPISFGLTITVGGNFTFAGSMNSGASTIALNVTGTARATGGASQTLTQIDANGGSTLYADQCNDGGGNDNVTFGPAVIGITNVTSNHADGTVKAGAVVDIQATFSGNATVTGAPRLAMNLGNGSRYATYLSGSGTSVLTFRLTIAAGDTSADLDYVDVNSLGLNGGTIKDDTTVDAVLTLPTPGDAGSISANKAIVVDALAPVVTNITSAHANGSFKAGEVIDITATFDQAVTVTGTPRLAMALSNGSRFATYLSGSASATLTFRLTIIALDASADLDYTATSALGLNGGTIVATDDGVTATLTLPTPGAAGSLGANKAIVIDATAPTEINVTSPMPDGDYDADGQVVDVQLVFSESVIVTGTPQLLLDYVSGTQPASYVSGSGTATLTMRMTTAKNMHANNLSYVDANSLILNGGTIKDGAGNNAILTLPVPGAVGSLSVNKMINILSHIPKDGPGRRFWSPFIGL